MPAVAIAPRRTVTTCLDTSFVELAVAKRFTGMVGAFDAALDSCFVLDPPPVTSARSIHKVSWSSGCGAQRRNLSYPACEHRLRVMQRECHPVVEVRIGRLMVAHGLDLGLEKR